MGPPLITAWRQPSRWRHSGDAPRLRGGRPRARTWGVKGWRFLKAAFLMPANLIALGASGVAALLTGEPSVLLVALGAESLYLGALSSASTFQRAVRAGDLAEDVDP